MMETQRLRILLVDDDELDRRMIEYFVTQAGLPYDLILARNVAEAIAHLCMGKLDLVLTEYRLPDGYGLEVQQYARHIPCIFLTRVASRDSIVRAMKAGASDFLIKDSQWVYLRELPLAIQEALARYADALAGKPPPPLYVTSDTAVQS
jgi:DNA-binding NtrC family response regulator